MKKTVVVGFLGSVLDTGKAGARWDAWRPSVDLCRHDDLVVHRFELLSTKRFTPTAKVVAADIRSVSPETEVRIHDVDFDDPWDVGEV